MKRLQNLADLKHEKAAFRIQSSSSSISPLRVLRTQLNMIIIDNNIVAKVIYILKI